MAGRWGRQSDYERDGRGRPVPVVLARVRPDEGAAFAVLVIEQIRAARRVEGGIVELEREGVVALFAALRPGGSDRIPAHVDGVARALSLERLVSATENHASKSNSI
jgi:hypothetical protein